MNDLPKGPVEDLTKIVDEFFSKLKGVLRKLELPDGPKLTHQHIGLIGVTREFAFSSKKEATETKNALNRATNALKKASNKLKVLPARTHWRLNSYAEFDQKKSSSHGEDFDDELIYETNSLPVLESMQTALKDELQRVERERVLIWGGAGTTFDAEARYVAWKVAELHRYLRKEYPTMSKSHFGDPSSPYTRAVSQVFQLLSIKTDYRSPCLHVINELKKRKPFPHPEIELSLINDPNYRYTIRKK
jgi:hypothetical protein